MFSIESRDPALDIDDIVASLQLVDYDTYIARCTAAQRKGRINPPVVPQPGGLAEPAE